jgi:glycosyltransferase involved in cell wall biosynthesis
MQNINHPKISIITVVFNHKHQFEKTINAIFKLDYPFIESIVVDGGSTDGTVEVIKENLDKIALWKSERDNGLYDAMNKGINMSTGDYLWFI